MIISTVTIEEAVICLQAYCDFFENPEARLLSASALAGCNISDIVARFGAEDARTVLFPHRLETRARDYATALQDEREIVGKTLRSWQHFGNFRRNVEADFHASANRLLLLEVMPSFLRPVVARDPGAWTNETLERAKLVCLLWNSRHFSISELMMPGVGIAQQPLGILVEKGMMFAYQRLIR